MDNNPGYPFCPSVNQGLGKPDEASNIHVETTVTPPKSPTEKIK